MHLMDRIFPKLEWRGDCLVWTGPTNDYGYGQISHRQSGTRLVHRIVLENHAEIPPGLNALHSCDNPPCCNPEHLKPGTQAQNIQECIERGRFVPRAPLTHCKRDHALTAENVRVDKNGVRHCRKCGAVRMKKHRAKARAKRMA